MVKNFHIGEDLLFHPETNTLTFTGKIKETLVLGENESRLLMYFIIHRNHIIPRKELIEFVWKKRRIIVNDSSLTQSISNLRRALRDSSRKPTFIKTIPKSGYKFIAPVREVIVNEDENSDDIILYNVDNDSMYKNVTTPEVVDSKNTELIQQKKTLLNDLINNLLVFLTVFFLTLLVNDMLIEWITIIWSRL
ncbi:winged helix-turn-helix domain-containing protein [Vibrio parahaemolyticus]|uniref:winged helix-turn-helix domain-containing protein n=1 Tax=Vibrio parahaemolyticus TaxID=670 RepID=UPI00287906AB|nr:winged helix-turn-helix domain-containing protein [Vibrio parahaemolyticus]MDS1924700.1 winged helix-turn-helix domain-containing protein [Vibrio parahaemolyticus]